MAVIGWDSRVPSWETGPKQRNASTKGSYFGPPPRDVKVWYRNSQPRARTGTPPALTAAIGALWKTLFCSAGEPSLKSAVKLTPCVVNLGSRLSSRREGETRAKEAKNRSDNHHTTTHTAMSTHNRLTTHTCHNHTRAPGCRQRALRQHSGGVVRTMGGVDCWTPAGPHECVAIAGARVGNGEPAEGEQNKRRGARPVAAHGPLRARRAARTSRAPHAPCKTRGARAPCSARSPS